MHFLWWGKPKSPDERIHKEVRKAQKTMRLLRKTPLMQGDPWNIIDPCNKPLGALVQIVIFTSRNVPKGPSDPFQLSPVIHGLISDSVKMPLIDIVKSVPISVVNEPSVLRSIEEVGLMPDAGWTAVASVRPDLAERARDGLLDVYIRPYLDPPRADSGIAFFFYRAG